MKLPGPASEKAKSAPVGRLLRSSLILRLTDCHRQ